MDVIAKIDELVKKIKADDGLAKRFAKEPIKTLEDLLGVDLPDEQFKELLEGIKAKLNLEDAGGKLGDLADKVGLDDLADKVGDKLGDLFGKK